MLAAMRRGGLSEAFWAMIGAAVALSPSAGEALWKAFHDDPPVPLSSPLHLIEVVALGITISLAIAFEIIGLYRGKRIKDLVSEIRARGAI
jgi:membrane associated rhomboid family serine protease